jgi:hypothetical protein
MNLFENPWGYAIVLIIGALVNWLAKRSQNRQAAQSPQGDVPPAKANPSSAEYNLEDALRRFMGEDPLAPRPLPPVIPESGPAGTTQVADAGEVQFRSTPGQSPADTRVPPRETVPGFVTLTRGDAEAETAMLRSEDSREQGLLSRAAPDQHFRLRASKPTRRTSTSWRRPGTARQAWVASIVFGPPPSLRP